MTRKIIQENIEVTIQFNQEGFSSQIIEESPRPRNPKEEKER